MPRTKTTKPPPGASEKIVTEQVLEAAAMLGLTLVRQNVGGLYNAAGQYVAFGSPGDADYTAQLDDGRTLMLELKRESFCPRKVRGAAAARWARQLAKLRAANASGNVGIWVRAGDDFLRAMQLILMGARVEIDPAGFCWVTDEAPGKPHSDPIRSDFTTQDEDR
jgi:hypothetical protein